MGPPFEKPLIFEVSGFFYFREFNKKNLPLPRGIQIIPRLVRPHQVPKSFEQLHFSHSDFDNNICLLNWGNVRMINCPSPHFSVFVRSPLAVSTAA
jgi:hypothetical protein